MTHFFLSYSQCRSIQTVSVLFLLNKNKRRQWQWIYMREYEWDSNRDEKKKLRNKNFAVEIKLLDNLLPLVSRCKSHKVWNNSNGNFHCLLPHGSYPRKEKKSSVNNVKNERICHFIIIKYCCCCSLCVNKELLKLTTVDEFNWNERPPRSRVSVQFIRWLIVTIVRCYYRIFCVRAVSCIKVYLVHNWNSSVLAQTTFWRDMSTTWQTCLMVSVNIKQLKWSKLFGWNWIYLDVKFMGWFY